MLKQLRATTSVNLWVSASTGQNFGVKQQFHFGELTPPRGYPVRTRLNPATEFPFCRPSNIVPTLDSGTESGLIPIARRFDAVMWRLPPLKVSVAGFSCESRGAASLQVGSTESRPASVVQWEDAGMSKQPIQQQQQASSGAAVFSKLPQKALQVGHDNAESGRVPDIESDEMVMSWLLAPKDAAALSNRPPRPIIAQ